MLRTPLCDLLDIEYPILQGGMAWLGTFELASAVSNAGGHIGEITTMALVPQVAEAVDLPVVAAGGFADGRGLAAAMALGAHGVQIGTRFICAQECIAHPNYKKKIIEAVDRSTVVTGVTTGHPVRCLENRLTRLFAEREKAGPPPEELDKLGEGKLYLAAILGDVENGSVMAGQSAALVKDIKPAKDIVEGIVREAEEVIKRLAALPQPVSHV